MAKFSTHLNSIDMGMREAKSTENTVKILLERAVSERVFPGAAAGILIDRHERRENYIWTAGYTDQNKTDQVNQQTLYDLASLTKPLVTTLSILALIERGKLDFATPLQAVFKESIPPSKKNITIGYLLQHRSGLPAYRPYYIDLNTIEGCEKRRKKIVEDILEEPLEQQPGTVSVYSDLGFVLLGYIIEMIAAESLEVFWNRNFTYPLLLQNDLLFQPSLKMKDTKNIAATEECQWARRMLCGEVHDENCRSLGGISGHAGLFGTVRGVLDLCGILLRIWRGEQILPACSTPLLRKAFDRERNVDWCYGFDTPTGDKSSSGKYFSQKTVGHLGYTGTSFWIDLNRGIVIVLLTNRVHPDRKNERIKQFRPIFHDELMERLVEITA